MDFVLELAKLIKQTPKHHLPSQDNENCPYNSFLYKSKDCHLCYSCCFLQSCFYLETCLSDTDCIDGDYLNHCELCYECTDCDKCYNCDFCQDCKNCTDVSFSYDCQGCTNCFGCVGLRKKEFYIFNVPHSREDYLKKIKTLKKQPTAEIQKQVDALRLKFPHPPMHSVGSENSFGEYIKNTKNCYMCFNVENANDCAYLYDEILNLQDCVDSDHITNSQLCYNTMSIDSCYNVNSSWWMVNCRDCEYGFCNNSCANCFGCVNMQRREYCILNKQYARDEYFKKLAEIKNDLRTKNLYGRFLLADAVELAKTLSS